MTHAEIEETVKQLKKENEALRAQLNSLIARYNMHEHVDAYSGPMKWYRAGEKP